MLFRFYQSTAREIANMVRTGLFEESSRNPERDYIYHSAPCYRYTFPTDDLSSLEKYEHKLSYSSGGS
ncbi:MAG: hypothetical protein ACFFBY_03115 [Promethearchaeota archaeon]